VVSNTKYNGYLKEIASIVGIKMHLTTHIARKTFATTIMLTNGVNIGVLSRLLGHSNVNITLDAYGTFNDQLLLSHVDMIRKKLVAEKTNSNKEKPQNISATNILLDAFKRDGNMN
jgi:integrase/recombinase XerD